MKTQTKLMIFLITLVVFGFFFASAKEKSGQAKRNLAKASDQISYQLMNANNITTWVRGDGFFNWQIAQSWNGEFPRSSGVGGIFSEGIVFGGLVSDGLYSQILRITGDTYFIGMCPGSILTDANRNSTGPEVTTLPSVRTYAVRSDMPPSIQSFRSSWHDLSVDAATFFQVSSSNVTETQIQTIATQYFKDWNEWPAAKGAPWYIDTVKIVRNDAAYDNTNVHHIPGIPGASKTIWYVCNDLDASVTQTFAGSPPMGMEEQITLWAYASSTPLNNIIFKQVKLIYKGNPGAPNNSKIDSMYIVQWADGDIGYAGDDYAGCDSSLNLGYEYNSAVMDTKYAAVGLPAPAVGYAFLQGASHYTGNMNDSAVINFRWIKGYRYWYANPLTAFDYFGSNSSISDPDDGVYDATLQWYNLMRGDLPRPQYPAGTPFYTSSDYASNHGITTPYCLSGDPTTGQGWIDGIDRVGSDRRMVNVHGPITLKLRDTAEIVIALVGGMGVDNISSIQVLKSNSLFAKTFYDHLLLNALPPRLSCNTVYSSATTISLQADAHTINASGVAVNLRKYDGSLVGSAVLADDGLHNDGGAGDKIFGASIQVPQQQTGLYAEATVTYENGGVVTWPHLIDNISTAGPVTVTSYSIASDNLNGDGIANPGENIRYIFSIINNSSIGFSNLTLLASPNSDRRSLSIPSLNAVSVFALVYDQYNPSTYLSFTVPSGYTDPTCTVILTITDLNHNQWMDTLVFTVRPLSHPLYSSPVMHVAGNSTGNFAISIVDSTRLKNHLYVITGVDSVAPNAGGYTIKDSTIGSILIANHFLPDPLGHTSPIVDGFKILLGTIDTLKGMKNFEIPSGIRRFSPIGGYPGLGLEGFSNASNPSAYDVTAGTIGMAGHFVFGGIGTTLTSAAQYHTVLLKLAAVDHVKLWNPLAAPTDPNFSLAYRYLRRANQAVADPSFTPWIISTVAGYPYQDYNYAVPFSAWDMGTTPPTRLAVGVFENNAVGGLVDDRYWPNDASIADNTVAREFCFIFKSPYTTTPDPALSVNMSGNTSTPLMWVMTCTRRVDVDWTTGDEFEIISYQPLTSMDRWIFNTSILTNVQQYAMPLTFSLSQNFPNPFNPSTKILYQLPATSKVSIKIYNVLGQEVRTLVNKVQNAGTQTAVWNSRNNAGQTVSSGVYFYYIEVIPISGKGNSFSDVKKMVLIK